MTHTVAAKQRLYLLLVKASVHIYKENKGGKMLQLLRQHIYFWKLCHQREGIRRVIWIIDMVNMENGGVGGQQTRMSDEAELDGIYQGSNQEQDLKRKRRK